MKESTTKEKVLKKVRDALVNSMPPPYDSVDMESSLLKATDAAFREEAFAEALKRAGGKFYFSADARELAYGIKALAGQENLQKVFCREAFLVDLLEELGIAHENQPEKVYECDATLTSCEALVVSHGSVVVSSALDCGRKGFIAAPFHIVVATSKQIVDDISGAFDLISRKYGRDLPSMISFISGPSRTADIEKTLVKGVHGPAELYLFMLDMGSADNT